MLELVIDVPFWLEFASVLTGALAGGMAAVKARYDVFGTASIACITGLGGGMIRDVLLQSYGIYAFQHPVLLLGAAAAGVAVFYFGKLISYLDWLIDFLDNISVGLWAVVSVGKALSADVGIVASIVLGTITAVGGGILRDVLMAQRPSVFQAGTLYGTASLFGSTVFALMKQNDVLGDYAAIACVLLVLVLRYAAEIFGWRTHPAHDYSDKVIDPVVKAAKAAAAPVRKIIAPGPTEPLDVPEMQRERERERDEATAARRRQATGELRIARQKSREQAHGDTSPAGLDTIVSDAADK